MPIRYVLANLLASNDGAVAVALLDDEGESVELVSAEYQPFEVRLVGAYLAISVRQAEELTKRSSLGETRHLQIQHGSLTIHVRPVDDGYFLALLQRTPNLGAKARVSLARAAEDLRRDLFDREPRQEVIA